jgi:hypothetical protein
MGIISQALSIFVALDHRQDALSPLFVGSKHDQRGSLVDGRVTNTEHLGQRFG